MNIKNTTSAVGRTRRMSTAMAVFAAVVTASTTFVSPAQADQKLPDGGGSASVTPFDVVDMVTERKIQMARDRIERAWLHA
jgi:hypothetical protein